MDSKLRGMQAAGRSMTVNVAVLNIYLPARNSYQWSSSIQPSS